MPLEFRQNPAEHEGIRQRHKTITCARRDWKEAVLCEFDEGGGGNGLCEDKEGGGWMWNACDRDRHRLRDRVRLPANKQRVGRMLER
jgi:sugar lactone lactonase YvrE